MYGQKYDHDIEKKYSFFRKRLLTIINDYFRFLNSDIARALIVSRLLYKCWGIKIEENRTTFFLANDLRLHKQINRKQRNKRLLIVIHCIFTKYND